MRQRHQPITMGSPSFRTLDTPWVRVTEAWFPPGALLDAHTHDRPVIAIMLDGSFETEIGGSRLECSPTTAWTEPCEERHANRIGSRGARVLVTQPDPSRVELIEPFNALLADVLCERSPDLALDARRVASEIANPDDLSPLVVDSLATLVLARASRLRVPRERSAAPPAWLRRARDLVHDRFRSPPSLEAVAECAGVTPWHLAREFRRYFHASVGEYARSLRVNFALERLASSREPISTIALEAGFADQSHLTRACRLAAGMPPAMYRRRMQRIGPLIDQSS